MKQHELIPKKAQSKKKSYTEEHILFNSIQITDKQNYGGKISEPWMLLRVEGWRLIRKGYEGRF